MNPVTFAIVGCGRIGSRHVELARKTGQLVALCDIELQKAETLAGSGSCKVYQNLDDLLEQTKPDVLVVCTPNGLHALHSIKGLEAGCHVICEKPMAIARLDCKKMIAASEKTGRHLFIVKQNRYNPPVAEVKKILDEGRLGKIFSAQLNCWWNRDEAYYQNSWKGTKQLDGGTLFTQFSHFIDLLYWFFGDVKNCNALLANYQHKNAIETEDSGIALLEFENGMMASVNYSVNSFKQNMEGSLTIIAEKGTVKIGGQYLNELEYQCIKDYRIESLPAGNPPNDYGHYTGSMSNHPLVYQNVVDVLNNGKTIATSGFAGMKTVEIIEKIYASAKWIDR